MMKAPAPQLVIFAGRFGSGKTEVAINYALSLANAHESAGGSHVRQADRTGATPAHSPGRAILVDLDIVTPYFRSRETADALMARGVEVIAPAAVGRHLDTPSITPQILGAIQQRRRPAVLDVGGDRQGARVLGQYSAAIEQRGYRLLFVVNPYRPFTDTLEGIRGSVAEIEASARLRVSGLVSNPNLMGETAAGLILEGHASIETHAASIGLPIAFVCIEKDMAAELGRNRFAQPLLLLERHFIQPWESGDGE